MAVNGKRSETPGAQAAPRPKLIPEQAQRSPTVRCIIAIGSNVEPEHNVPLALTCIADMFRVHDVSRFFQTSPVGPPGQPDFWNGAVLLETNLDRSSLVRALRRIEHLLGRRRSADRYAPRPIDLDVVGWDGQIDDVEAHLAKSLSDLNLGGAHEA